MNTPTPSQKNTDKYFSLLNVAVLLLLFLGAADVINRYYYFVYFAAIVFFVAPKRTLILNPACIHLFFLAMSILIFNPSAHTSITNMIRPFTYFLCFLLGSGIFQKPISHPESLEEKEKAVCKAFPVFAAGTLVHFVLNMIKNWGIDSRHVLDVWTNAEMSATGQATLACLSIVLAAAWLFSETKKWQKIVAIAILAITITYNLILAGRTIFVFIIIAIALAFVHRSIVHKKPIFKILFWLAVVFLVILLIYQLDLFGIKTAFEGSNFYDRFFGENNQEIDSDKRLEHKGYYIRHFFDHLFGGDKIREEYGHSAHDLYLDTHSESGIFAFIAIIAYIISSLFRAWHVMKSDKLTFATRQLLLCFYITVNIQFWLEPVMRGMPWLLATYCFIDGMVANLIALEKKSQKAS